MAGLQEPIVAILPYIALILRVWLGVNFLMHASPKLGKGTQQTVQWIGSIGLPAGAAYSAIGLELFGGIFLILGLITPVVALLFAVFMISNSIMKKSKMHASYIAQNQPTYELDVLYLMLSVVLIVLGAGAFSIDGLLGL